VGVARNFYFSLFYWRGPPTCSGFQDKKAVGGKTAHGFFCGKDEEGTTGFPAKKKIKEVKNHDR